MADLFEYSPNAITNIKANEKQIRAAADAAKKEATKKMKRVGHKLTYPEIDDGVFQFVEMARQKRFPVRPNFILNVAAFLALKMGFPSFKASQGWYRRFCSRHDIYFKKLHGNFKS